LSGWPGPVDALSSVTAMQALTDALRSLTCPQGFLSGVGGKMVFLFPVRLLDSRLDSFAVK